MTLDQERAAPLGCMFHAFLITGVIGGALFVIAKAFS